MTRIWETYGPHSGADEDLSCGMWRHVGSYSRRCFGAAHCLYPQSDPRSACVITPCSKVLLHKLTGFQPVKKFPAFYGTRRFITAFTSARHLPLFWASSTQSTPPTPHFLKIHLNIILPSTSGSPMWSLSVKFPNQNPVYASPLPTHAISHIYPILLGLITRTILDEEYRSLSSSLCSFLLTPVRPKYSPQHPILKHPQPTHFPQCERPSFKPIQNNRQNYSSVYLNL